MTARIDSVNSGDGVSFPRTRGFSTRTGEKVVPMELGVHLVPVEGHFPIGQRKFERIRLKAELMEEFVDR